jgi:cation transport ATPase
LFNVNIYPAGSTAGTLNDFLAFAKALVPNSEGSKKLFDNDETHNVMFTATLKFPGTEIDYNNHGFWSHEYNVQALGHGGNTIMNSSYKKYQIILCIAIILLLFIIIGVASMMLTMEAVVTKFIPYVIASILLGIIPLVYAIIFFKKKSTFSCTKGQKVSYVITMFMGFIMTIAIMALEMYKI